MTRAQARHLRGTDFTEFVRGHETRLRHALIAVFGGDLGREAASEALAYGWEHWDRIGGMDNPAGYLYRVGRTRGRQLLRRHTTLPAPPDPGRVPDVEPELDAALQDLSERQRAVVMLVHCFEWSLQEVADVLGLSKSTVQNHLERGMTALRRRIGTQR